MGRNKFPKEAVPYPVGVGTKSGSARFSPVLPCISCSHRMGTGCSPDSSPRPLRRHGFQVALPELLGGLLVGVPLCRRGVGQLLGLLLAGRAEVAEADGDTAAANDNFPELAPTRIQNDASYEAPWVRRKEDSPSALPASPFHLGEEQQEVLRADLRG
jgi:hypothetical protein